jgi:hypothetical protein
MAGTYTIEAADGGRPIDPQELRELRNLLREDEDLDLGVTLRDRPPAPGEQGAIPVAVEVAAALTPVVGGIAKVLSQWVASRRVVLKVTETSRGSKGRSIELSAGNAAQAERLLRSLTEDGEQ